MGRGVCRKSPSTPGTGSPPKTGRDPLFTPLLHEREQLTRPESSGSRRASGRSRPPLLRVGTWSAPTAISCSVAELSFLQARLRGKRRFYAHALQRALEPSLNLRHAQPARRGASFSSSPAAERSTCRGRRRYRWVAFSSRRSQPPRPAAPRSSQAASLPQPSRARAARRTRRPGSGGGGRQPERSPSSTRSLGAR